MTDRPTSLSLCSSHCLSVGGLRGGFALQLPSFFLSLPLSIYTRLLIINNTNQMNKKKGRIEVTMYTDGGCAKNPGGKGGIGVVLLHKKARKELSQGYLSTTNNRMELRAVIEGFKALKGDDYFVTVFSDSQYVVNPVAKGSIHTWKAQGFRKAKNADLWQELYQLIARHTVRFIWVRGHAETAENNRCDELATQAMRSNNLIPDNGYKLDVF